MADADVPGRLAELIRGMERRGDAYSRALQAARVRASYQRAYFAPALFRLIPVNAPTARVETSQSFGLGR